MLLCRVSPLGFAIALLYLILLSPSARAETYRDATHHFSFEIPAGWRVISPEELRLLNQGVNRAVSNNHIEYIAGFCLADKPMLDYPYILITRMAAPFYRTTYDEIERELSKDLGKSLGKIEGPINDIIKKIDANQPVIDRTRNRAILRMKADVANVGAIENLTVIHLGNHGYVALYSYAIQGDFDKYQPLFVEINDSFHYDEGEEYSPVSPAAMGYRIGQIIGGLLCVGFFAGGIIGIVRLFARARTSRG